MRHQPSAISELVLYVPHTNRMGQIVVNRVVIFTFSTCIVFGCMLSKRATLSLQVSISKLPGPFWDYSNFCNATNLAVSIFTKFGQHQLQQEMNASGTVEAWLPIKRRNLAHWTWLSGDIYKDTMKDSSNGTNMCAVLWRDAGIIGPDSCNITYHQYMCETSGGTCSNYDGYKDNRHLYCFMVENRTYTIYESDSTWFQAKQACQQKNARLASFEGKNEETIKSKVKDSSASTGKILIGLRATDYFYNTSQTTESDSSYFMWADKEPCVCPEKACVIVTSKSGSLQWVSEKCSVKHKFICSGMTTPVAEGVSAFLQSDVTSAIVENVKDTTEDPTGLASNVITAILVSCAIVFLLTLIIITIVIIKLKRRKPTERGGRHEKLPLMQKKGLSKKAINIRNQILKSKLHAKKDINIVMVGLPGAGKSSLISSLITALTPGDYHPVAKPGNFGEVAKPVTWFMEKYPLFTDQLKEHSCIKSQPVLWDCPGFLDDSSASTVTLLESIIMGRLPLSTELADVQHTAQFTLPNSTNELENTCSKMDLIIFVHDFESAVPEQLPEALLNATRSSKYNGGVILVLNKRDTVENDENKLQSVTDEMSKALGLYKEVDRIFCLSCYFAKENIPSTTVRRNPLIDKYMCSLWRQILNPVNHPK